MLRRNFKFGFVAAAILAASAGLGITTAPAASAAESVLPPMVPSDAAAFAGTATPTAVGDYVLASKRCALISDGESVMFPCTITLRFNLGTSRGSGVVTSDDGMAVWDFKLTQVGQSTFAVTGMCANSATGNLMGCFETEGENSTAPMDPADVSGTMTITPTAGTPEIPVSGMIAVYEPSTAP